MQELTKLPREREPEKMQIREAAIPLREEEA